MSDLLGFATGRNRFVAGESIRIVATFSDIIDLDMTNGVPVLSLSNGATAQFVEVNDNHQLVFVYDVNEFDNPTTDLTITAFALNNASLTSATGSTVNTTIITHSDSTPSERNNKISINGVTQNIEVATTPVNTDDLVAPKIASIYADSGQYKVGDKLNIRISFDEVVLVNVDSGVPTLSLTSNGQPIVSAMASYISGSGTKTLTFRYVVQDDVNVTDLSLGVMNLNGAMISDFAGNTANVNVPLLSNSVNITIGEVETVSQSASETALTSQNGPVVIETIRLRSHSQSDYKVGDVVTLNVNFSDSVNLETSAAPPILVLSNGGFATYQSGSGTNSFAFSYTVAPTDNNTQD